MPNQAALAQLELRAGQLAPPPTLMLGLLLLLASSPGAPASSHQPAPASQWHLLTNLQIGPTMALPGGSVSCTFSHPAAAASTAAWELQLRSRTGAVLASAKSPATAELKLPAADKGGTVYSWRARFGAADWSPDTTVFTTPWADGASSPPGLWAPNNATKSGPQFAFLRAALPKAKPSAAASSALLFVTADGPTRATGTPGGTRPLLGGYKAWVGGALVGTGPGRSKCGNNPTGGPQATVSPALCPKGIETIYDGIDVSAAVAACRAGPCEVFIEGYGYDQPTSPTQANVVIRRVAVELVLSYVDGSRWSSVHGGKIAPALQWQSYDADTIYLANLWGKGGGGHSKGQLSSSGGGAWYYYPHEYIDMSRMPSEMTPLAYPGSGAAAHAWLPAATKPALKNLVARPVPPVEISPVRPTLNRTIGPGHFFFDFGAELQGGMTLEVKDLAVAVTATVRFAEELIKENPKPHAKDLTTLAEQTASLDWRGHPVYPDALTIPTAAKAMGPCETGHGSTDAACHSANSSCWGRPCYSMRTGSLYEDVWTLPAASPGSAARAQNHEYITGRYAEVVFNDTSIQASQVTLGAFQVKARYSSTDLATMASSHPGREYNDAVSCLPPSRSASCVRCITVIVCSGRGVGDDAAHQRGDKPGPICGFERPAAEC